MKAQEEITQAFENKGWKVKSYDYQPRQDEYRYEVVIETEDYPELWPQSDATDALNEAYDSAFDVIERAFRAAGDWGTDCGPVILADRKADVLKIAKLLPARLSIAVPTL